ncbi:hypothetical protein I4U23_005987 [Adineta vaga]|nr:hypothetical protein I4U23_005987 [Adineta vaga]
MMRMGKWEQAEFFYKKNDWQRHASILINLGTIYYEQDLLDKSFDYFLQTLRKFREYISDHDSYLHSVYNNIGNVYHKQKKLEISFQYLEHSLNIAKASPGTPTPTPTPYQELDRYNLVYEVAEQLRRENIPVWMDIRNGLDGYLNDGMAEAVENSLAVCFFMTPEYQKSKNCKRELEYADKLEIPVISCRCRADFKPSGWLGLIAAGLVSYDFRDLSDKPVNATMNKLINYIQRSILKIAPTVFPGKKKSKVVLIDEEEFIFI